MSSVFFFFFPFVTIKMCFVDIWGCWAVIFIIAAATVVYFIIEQKKKKILYLMFVINFFDVHGHYIRKVERIRIRKQYN